MFHSRAVIITSIVQNTIFIHVIYLFDIGMSSLVGARVVRGPDWIWGDQDGGEGYAGTIIPTPASDLKLSGPRTVKVLWDSGMKFSYQAGPEGHYNLRVGLNR